VNEAPPKTLTVRPIQGQWDFDSAQDIPEGASPDMQNFRVIQGALVKRAGYAQFPAGAAALDGPVTGIYSLLDSAGNLRLFATTRASVYQWSSGGGVWNKQTGPALTGGTYDRFSFEVSQNCLVFSQGIDNIMSLPLAGSTYAALSAGSFPSFYLARFADRLYASLTVEGGALKPFRTRWPVNSDHTDWGGIGSGFRDNTEQPYFIKGMRSLLQQLVVYTERSAIVATRTGILPPAQFDIVVTDIGLYGSYTLQGRNNTHIFLGNDDVYEFNGSQAVSVATPIRELLFRTLDGPNAKNNWAVILHDTPEYMMFLYTTAGTAPDTVWVYNHLRNIWYKWITPPLMLAGTMHRVETNSTIDSLVGTIDQQNWQFDTRGLSANTPVLITGGLDGKVYIWSQLSSNDNGTPIVAYWTSRDYRGVDYGPEWVLHKVTIRGVGVTYMETGSPITLQLYYSVDGGVWQGPYTSTMGGDGLVGQISDMVFWQQVTGNRIAFRIQDAGLDQSPRLLSFHPIIEPSAELVSP